MLFRKLIVVENLRLLRTLVIYEGHFNPAGFIGPRLDVFLSINDCFGRSQVLFFEPKTGLWRWLVQSQILKTLFDLLGGLVTGR